MAFIAGGPALSGAYKQNARMCKCSHNPVRNPSRMSSLDGVPLAGLGAQEFGPQLPGVVTAHDFTSIADFGGEIQSKPLASSVFAEKESVEYWYGQDKAAQAASGKKTALWVAAAATAFLLLRK